MKFNIPIVVRLVECTQWFVNQFCGHNNIVYILGAEGLSIMFFQFKVQYHVIIYHHYFIFIFKLPNLKFIPKTFI